MPIIDYDCCKDCQNWEGLGGPCPKTGRDRGDGYRKACKTIHFRLYNPTHEKEKLAILTYDKGNDIQVHECKCKGGGCKNCSGGCKGGCGGCDD